MLWSTRVVLSSVSASSHLQVLDSGPWEVVNISLSVCLWSLLLIPQLSFHLLFDPLHSTGLSFTSFVKSLLPHKLTQLLMTTRFILLLTLI